MKHVPLLTLAAVLSLAGCATSSGVQNTGPNTFTISTAASPGRGGVPAAKRAAYEEAQAECRKRGLVFQVVDESTKSPTFTEGMASASLNFRCSPT